MNWLDSTDAWSLVAIFVTCLVAGSIVPVGSEVAVAAGAAAGVPLVPLVVVSTLGNVAGACANYATGRLGANWWRRWRGQGATPDASAELSRARRWVERWGAPAMVLSWLPVVGDPLTLVAGAARVEFLPFVAWVTVGKAARYIVVAYATGAVVGAVGQ